MPQTATPLSYNYAIKEAIDECRAITKEEDEQVVSDDNIRAHLQFATHNLQKLFRVVRYQYQVDIPFVVDDTADPLVSTLVRPTTSRTARPVKILQAPVGATPTLNQATGLYDFHYQHPTNFTILEWLDCWNELTGSCRRTQDFTNLMGHCLNANTHLARTVGFFNWEISNVLYVSVREGMIQNGQNVIVHGIGIRTPIKLIELTVSATPTYASTNHTSSTEDETKRYVPEVNDWDKIDCPDDYVPLIINMAAVKIWSQVGKISKEAEAAQLEQLYGQYFDTSEMRLMEKETTRKDTQYRDRGTM